VTPGETDAHAELGELRAQLAAATRREAELRELLADAHDQLAQRDEELVRSAMNHRRVEAMRQTRVWRMGESWWRTRDRIKAGFGRRRA
jgi:hypothetical protein